MARQEYPLGGKSVAVFDRGVWEVVFDGVIDVPAARALLQASARHPTGTHNVWVVDVSALKDFTAEARKVMSSWDGGPAQAAESHTHAFFAGAGIRTKAILALVMAATRLIGNLRYHATHVATFQEARRAGHAKQAELVEAGLAPPPPDA